MSRERGCVGATFYPALLVCMISKHPAKSPNYIQCAHAYLYTFIHPFSESHIPFSGFKEAETSLLTGGKRRGTSWAERDTCMAIVRGLSCLILYLFYLYFIIVSCSVVFIRFYYINAFLEFLVPPSSLMFLCI